MQIIDKQQEVDSKKFVFKKYYSIVFKICMRYASSEEHAKHLIQKCFVSILKKERICSDLVKEIALNKSIDYIKSQNNKKDFIVDCDLSDEKFNEILKNISIEDVFKVLQKLNPIERAVYNMYSFDNYSHKAISKKINISIETSKDNYHQAKKYLKFSLIEMNES